MNGDSSSASTICDLVTWKRNVARRKGSKRVSLIFRKLLGGGGEIEEEEDKQELLDTIG